MRATWQRSFGNRWHVPVVLLIGALGMALVLRGWRSGVPGDDAIPYIGGAHTLLTKGLLPDHGHPTNWAAVTFLHGLAAEELHSEKFDHHDADYELLITARVVK